MLPVSSLEARAAVVEEDGLILSLLDARKGRAYAGLFRRSADGLERMGEEQDIPPEEAVALAGGRPFIAVGEGAVVWEELVRSAGGRLWPEADICPALQVARFGIDRMAQALSPVAVQLNYIRPSDARPPGDS